MFSNLLYIPGIIISLVVLAWQESSKVYLFDHRNPNRNIIRCPEWAAEFMCAINGHYDYSETEA